MDLRGTRKRFSPPRVWSRFIDHRVQCLACSHHKHGIIIADALPTDRMGHFGLTLKRRLNMRAENGDPSINNNVQRIIIFVIVIISTHVADTRLCHQFSSPPLHHLVSVKNARCYNIRKNDNESTNMVSRVKNNITI
jgi:hypothetical protein